MLEDDQNNHFKYPKIIIALHSLNHSLHIIKIILKIYWLRWYVRFSNQTVRLNDITRSNVHGLHALYRGEIDHM